ncbi:2207_t:CDS:2 [Diversispora eburnea]|uniref:Carbonic anhydrase n=1 Tax=Diversispora eburnea TaxID=1213867 RepID=A0A9N8YNW9_9GLOM|nr:2207_t:CDS:2 [Diversispora eburnea]
MGVRILSKNNARIQLAEWLKTFPSLKNAKLKILNSMKSSTTSKNIQYHNPQLESQYESSLLPFFQSSQTSPSKIIIPPTSPYHHQLPTSKTTRIDKTHQDHLDNQNSYEIKAYLPVLLRSFKNLQDIFVHRNIANQFKTDDVNSMSELEFAVHYLKVEHIIVCGHTKCKGIESACENLRNNLNTWLSDIRKIKESCPELFPDQEAISRMGNNERNKIHKALVKKNVINQVQKISSSEIVKEAWREERRKLAIHGWVLNMENGHLEDLGITIRK